MIMLTGTNLDTGASLADAANSDAFTYALGLEPEPEQEQEEAPEQEEEELEEQEGEELEDEGEEPEDEGEEQEAEEEDEPEEDEPEKDIYVVTIDGEELEVSEDELLSGYKRTRDYNEQSASLRAKQDELDALIEETSKQRAAYSSFLEEELERESDRLKEFNDIDWNKLKAEDVNTFLLKQYELNEVRNSIQAKREKFEKAQEDAGTTLSSRDSRVIEREQERVKELVEGWGGENHSKIVSRLQAQATTEGFTDDDNDLLRHAQVIKLLDKAAKYDELQEKKANVIEKKVKREVPKVVKPGNKQSADGQKTTAYKKQLNKLKQTGSLNDSVDLFKQFV